MLLKIPIFKHFHFRLVSRIMATNKFLHIIGKAEDDLCSFCSAHVETLYHLFWECMEVQTFIARTAHILRFNFEFVSHTSKKTWFFPNLDECEDIQILINSIAKMTIYSARHNNCKPSIQQFVNTLKLEADKEFHSARLAGNITEFHGKWKQLKSIPLINMIDIATT